MKLALLSLALAACAFGQVAQPVRFVTADPAGACANGTAMRYNYMNGALWGCKAGVWTQVSGGGGGLTIGTTTITSGTTTRVLFDNAGVLGEYTISGTGNVAMTTSPSFTTPSLGTPSSVTLTNATGLPISGITGLGTGVGTALAANVTGSGGIALATSPAFTTPNLGTPSAATLTNATGLPIAGITGLGTGVASALATNVSGTGAICLASGSACSGGGSGITIGTTTITSGTNTRVLFNNAGVAGEYSISGSGNVAMTTSPTFTTPALGTPSAAVLTNATGLPLSGHTSQSADTVVMNATGGSAAPTAVAMPTCTTGADLYNTSTHAWACVSAGGGITLTAPVSGDWTAFGTGMAQAPTFASSRFTFTSSSQTTDLIQGIAHAIPSAPYTRYFRVWPFVGIKSFSGAGIALADGTVGTPGKITVCGITVNISGQGTIGPAELGGGNYTNTTTFSSVITPTLPLISGLTVGTGRPIWFKFVDDNTNWTCSVSLGDYDGATDSTGNWLTVWTETRNTFVTATQLLVYVNGYTNRAAVVFDSYK